ncbi:MAG: hypothetical protein WKG01_36595 [Kofleriaceae bacterium]
MSSDRLRSLGASCVLLAALAGCPTVDLGDTPTDIGLCNPPGGIEYFQDRIWPEFVRPGTANACTKAGGCTEAGGNALAFDSSAAPDFAANYRQAQVFLNCGTPNASLLLVKPLAGIEPHGGADIFQPSDAAVTTFNGWFE